MSYMDILKAAQQQSGIASVSPQPWTAEQMRAYDTTTRGTDNSFLSSYFKNPQYDAAWKAELEHQNQLLSQLPKTGWEIENEGTRQGYLTAGSNAESGGAAMSNIQSLYGTTEPTEYDPNSRYAYAYGPGNTMYRAKVDAQGTAIPGSLSMGSLDEGPLWDAAVMAAMAVTGANIGAAAGMMGGAGTAGGGGAGAAGSLPEASYSLEGAHYGLGGLDAATAGPMAGSAGSLEALPAASYSLEGAHYGLGGLNPATASPINAIPGVPSGLEGLPGADYSHEGLNYGPGGLNPTTASPINAVPGVPSGLPELPGADYSHEGGNYGPGGLDAATNAPVNVGAGAPGSALSNLGSSFKDWAAKNPIQAIQLAGMLGGKLFGGGQTISGGGIGSTGGVQADLTKNMPAAYSRQYVAPPAGYRPGISGEHVYFKNTGG